MQGWFIAKGQDIAMTPKETIKKALRRCVMVLGPIKSDNSIATATNMIYSSLVEERKKHGGGKNGSGGETKPPLQLPETNSSGNAEAAIAQGENIIGMCEEVPERGEDFAMSVSEKVSDIIASIEDRGYVTEGQQDALDNMEEGVAKWLR